MILYIIVTMFISYTGYCLLIITVDLCIRVYALNAAIGKY